MYLIDTSVWIDFLRGRKNASIKYFEKILENQIPFGLTGIIYQEVLQGAKSQADFKMLEEYLLTQRFFHPHNQIQTYKKAAQLYFECRRKGMTIRSTIDCFIAQITIENNLILLHNDQDYLQIKKISPALKLQVLN